VPGFNQHSYPCRQQVAEFHLTDILVSNYENYNEDMVMRRIQPRLSTT